MTQPTERPHPEAEGLNAGDTAGLMRLMNREDGGIAAAVAANLQAITVVVERVAERLAAGGRLHYFGAGTSGRLAVLDATECPPTFGVEPDVVVAHLAGGPGAFREAVESAEDSAEEGRLDALGAHLGGADAVIGSAASGSTPYVLGALQAAREAGAFTVALTCVAGSRIGGVVDIAIEVEVGPEVIAGSTRLKAGTAQKLVLNMISTGVFTRLGRVYRGRMVEVRPTNAKLRERAIQIVADLAACDLEAAREALAAAADSPRVAIVMLAGGLDRERAEAILNTAGGRLELALKGARR